MLYVAVVVFPLVCLVSGAASLFSVISFVREISRDLAISSTSNEAS